MLVSTTMFKTCYIMIRTITGVITFTQHVGLHDNVRDMLHYDTYHYWGCNLHRTCWSPRQCCETCYNIMIRTITRVITFTHHVGLHHKCTVTGVITFTQNVGLHDNVLDMLHYDTYRYWGYNLHTNADLHDNVLDMLHYDTYRYWGYNLHTTCWSLRQCSRHVTL